MANPDSAIAFASALLRSPEIIAVSLRILSAKLPAIMVSKLNIHKTKTKAIP
jgi:hypothetical protein